MIHVITHGCAAHGTFRCLFDTGMNAPITAHIGQTSLEEYTAKCSTKVLIKYRIDGRI